jgi:hypothetical protein
MPDQPPGIPTNEPVLWDLKTVARITGRPLALIQRWVVPGPKGEPPILPSVKETQHPFRRRVRPEDIAVSGDKRHWGIRKTGRTRITKTQAGREITMTEREPTDSRWPDEP